MLRRSVLPVVASSPRRFLSRAETYQEINPVSGSRHLIGSRRVSGEVNHLSRQALDRQIRGRARSRHRAVALGAYPDHDHQRPAACNAAGRRSRLSAVSFTKLLVDRERVAAATREFLLAIGEDPNREGLRDTPMRVAKAAEELFGGLSQDPGELLATTFDISHDEMVLVRDIELQSMCEHHLLPFIGVAHVGYIPAKDGRVTGLSKIARLVEVYARRPQVQERLTTQVADALVKHLGARGVIVVVEAEHMCMTTRGVRKPGARTVTSAVRGILRNPATRAEAMGLITAGR